MIGARSHHPYLSFLACLAFSRVPQSPISLGKAREGGRLLNICLTPSQNSNVCRPNITCLNPPSRWQVQSRNLFQLVNPIMGDKGDTNIDFTSLHPFSFPEPVVSWSRGRETRGSGSNTAAKRLRMRQVEHFRSLFQSPFPVRSSLLLRRFVFCMTEESAKGVTGDHNKPQGTMGRVQTAGEVVR